MLKAYHEKPKSELVILNNKLGLENPMHSESCVGQVAEKEEDTESEVRLGNDQQPIKLQNSQILNVFRYKTVPFTPSSKKRVSRSYYSVQGRKYFPMSQVRLI